MKNTNVSFSFNFKDFEKISESHGEKLVGGFSQVVAQAMVEFDKDPGGSNNCDGGNCKAGCGNGQNIQCNTVAGCGV